MLAELIQREIVDQHLLDQQTQHGSLRLSGSGGCLRSKWLMYHDVVELEFVEPSYMSVEPLSIGNYHHDRLQDTLKNALNKFLPNAEHFIVDENGREQDLVLEVDGIKIPGHPDGTVTIDGVKYVIEFKTMKNYPFMLFKKGDVSEGYIKQVHSYMHLTGSTKAIFLAYAKETGEIAELIVDYSQPIMDEVLADFSTAITATEAPVIPYDFNKETGKIDWHCTYCPYLQYCWPGAEERTTTKGTRESFLNVTPKRLRKDIPKGLAYSSLRELTKKSDKDSSQPHDILAEQAETMQSLAVGGRKFGAEDLTILLNSRDQMLFENIKPKKCKKCKKFILPHGTNLVLMRTETLANEKGYCSTCEGEDDPW